MSMKSEYIPVEMPGEQSLREQALNYVLRVTAVNKTDVVHHEVSSVMTDTVLCMHSSNKH